MILIVVVGFIVSFFLLKILDPKSPIFPRVVQNGCGGYAVQIRESPEHSGPGAYYFIGVRPKSLINKCAHTGFLRSSGGYVTLGDEYCIVDTLGIEVLKQQRHDSAWSHIADTMYTYKSPYELIFKTRESATAAMNSYLRRLEYETSFSDSIAKCHTYGTN